MGGSSDAVRPQTDADIPPPQEHEGHSSCPRPSSWHSAESRGTTACTYRIPDELWTIFGRCSRHSTQLQEMMFLVPCLLLPKTIKKFLNSCLQKKKKKKKKNFLKAVFKKKKKKKKKK